jgi:hypothetical protein
MAIRVHSFVSSLKRYIQVESQSHHITGVLRKVMECISIRGCDFIDIINAFYECEEDGTITFYQANRPDVDNPGIWTYLVYECPEGQEKIFREPAVNTSITPLYELLAGEKLVQETVDIEQYLQYHYQESDYLDIKLPNNWNNVEGRVIAGLLLQEFRALKSSSIFTEAVGLEYAKVVLKQFVQAGTQILEVGGTVDDFESAQYDILNQVNIDGMANLIMDCNDYRIWQALLPSQSKAVEYAFNSALNLISQVK